MRTLVSLLAGIIIGAALMWGVLMLTGGWYEYHIFQPSDRDVLSMVNADGWELIGYPHSDGDSRIFYLRRPRVRLH